VPADEEATRLAGPPGSIANGSGPAEWLAPERPQIRVVAALRDDVAAKMFARHQINRASFLAARKYQSIHEVAEGARMRSCDPSMPAISGGRGDAAGGIDHWLRAHVAGSSAPTPGLTGKEQTQRTSLTGAQWR
jgi:hypothetical protein